MIVTEFLNIISSDDAYVHSSLYLKSSNDNGCVYKYLIKSRDMGIRKEIFIELNPEENELDLLEKTVINSIEVYPAI